MYYGGLYRGWDPRGTLVVGEGGSEQICRGRGDPRSIHSSLRGGPWVCTEVGGVEEALQV